MQGNFQKQPQIKILPAFSVNEGPRLREADIEDVVKTVQNVLPRHIDWNIDVTIALLEKNLKIVADIALMKEALTHLVRSAMDAIPGYGKLSLTINQVNFEIESLLNSDDSILGAGTFISLAEGSADVSVDDMLKEKIFEPFFTTMAQGNDPGLAIAYRIIKQQQHHGRIRVESRAGQGTEVNIYLPLTKLEIVKMMSIPAA